ncbi:DNA-binding response regulator [Paraburkholderia caffeinilytica]|uniref:DNA-binding response regulator n=1 Tax=Paraburkholderia caffeinilytica TaxID=1761016 RepID=A0ABQ1MP22_9BURK|nr:response regulator transcription factor [Paraburkholderia caffeinilytica]AXL50489.1 DNA-binding response regulator [Paraburkholderia caffeinilytica]GGC43746.1 DNA-binding response regulator [Paraburkholderia caffeinilytica]CAB3790200.1 putative transcriptional regulatory protein NarL [Paraburkholderia caffeinilytica]
MQSTRTGQQPFFIHVAIVEHDAGFVDALTQAVNGAPGMRLTGVAGTRAEGLALLEDPPADVLLVDLRLPDGPGIDVIHTAARQWALCNIMVSTNFGDEAHVMRSIEAGATGYLLKDSSPTKMVEEICSLASGGSPISPIVARQILARVRQGGAESGGRNAGFVPLLSASEVEVLDQITKGFQTQEIAERMRLSPFTVKTVVRRIYGKLRVAS